MTEEWRSIPGYEGHYEVSDMGRVRSMTRINARGARLIGRLLRIKINSNGYRAVALYKNNKRIDAPVSRLMGIAFLNIGADQIADHRNRIRLDDALNNLRAATKAENGCNKGAYKNNRSGHKGVCWKSRIDKWCAQIQRAGIVHHLGYFDDPQQAAHAYCIASGQLHGAFACTGGA